MESDAVQSFALIDSCRERLRQLGRELEENCEEQRLCDQLGAFTLPIHKRVVEDSGEATQSLVIPTPPPCWHGRPAHRHEFVYMHMLLLLARAVNRRFHEWCHYALGEYVVRNLSSQPVQLYVLRDHDCLVC